MGATKILMDSTHFNEIRSIIRSRSVAWDALARSEELSEIDASTAKALESILVKKNIGDGLSSSNNAHSGFKVNGKTLIPLIHLLSTSDNEDCKKSVQNLIAELLSSDKYGDDTVKFFQEDPKQLEQLFDVSLKGDFQTVLISGFNVVSLLVQNGLHNVKLVEKLLKNNNLINILQNIEQMDTCYVCIRLLQELAVIPEYRDVIWLHEKKFMPTLFKILQRATDSQLATRIVATNSNHLGIQLQYHSLLLIWLLTFNPVFANELVQKYLSDFLDLLKLVKITIKEKVSRLCISIILQCCSTRVKQHKKVIKQLLLLGNALPTVQSLSERKYSDEELRQDISNLKEILENEYQELTSFDEYSSELKSGRLEWSPVHKSEKFWRENAVRLNEKNYELLKILTKLLEVSDDPQVLAVAAHDVGEYVRHYPRGKRVIEQLGGKQLVMNHMHHEDQQVRYNALLAVQKLMVHNWE
uniref:Fusion of yeast V-type proton ATPase subunit H(NT) and human V-type proton ATPase subunit H(CT) n=1 Tax=Homo sapiens TaxID=9606 RepID=UPI001E281C25|nr:Chain P, Fusion of yeast V-type proton ATPase subunit H(NT) and human V-type proton ATPase subunit H(CT) [synthetic construct]7FDB_P Chain P, Fusion of yeast V-type proton ATPase subunit H(NT) and human V-type proton ATPase subunit H(CT) [synthetic construct]7FDC_P Chain P, Fusion of yeast V-type proton ATPase subunit H(NT) and human V-type proton ATPase subunit H(CT) [synthetic construct]